MHRHKFREQRDEQLTATWTLTGIRSESREEQLAATWKLTGIRSTAETKVADSHADTNRHKVREQREKQLTATWTLTGIRSVSRERNN